MARSTTFLWTALTDTCSESMGPLTRFRRTTTCSLGDVCYLHWAHVHTHLSCQTSQVCHIVSDLRPFQPSLRPVTEYIPFAFCLITNSYQADRQWHIPLWSSGTAMRTHAFLRYGPRTLHSLTAEVPPARWSRCAI